MATTNNHKSPQSTFNEDLRDLWDQFILIQEQLLKRRCAPVSIIPGSIDLDGHKMTVLVDESGRDKIVDRVFNERLMVDPEDIKENYIFIKEGVWDSFSSSGIESIAKELASCYIRLDLMPSVNATVYYGNGVVFPNNQLTLEEINQLDKSLRDGHLCKGQVDDIIACIATLNVNLESFYRFIFGTEHYSRRTRGRKDEVFVQDVIEYKNHFIPVDTLRDYGAKIGLRLDSYRLVFTIDNPRAKEIMRDACNYYEPSRKAFVFKRPIDREELRDLDVLPEIQNNIRTFFTEARHYCSDNEIHVDTIFRYKTSNSKAVRYVFEMVSQYVYQHNNMSFNPETGNLGVDFNWRTDDIWQIISDLEKEFPYVTARTHGKEHRFKCSFSTEMVGYSDVENRLTERFENVTIENDASHHCVRISLPCPSIAYYDRLRDALQRELAYLNGTCNVIIDERVPGKVKLLMHRDEESRIEDIEDNLKDMRKADFGFEIGEKLVPFGKLLSVKYPKLIFDIDVEERQEEAVFEYINQKSFQFVDPILTGDIEKISRLKNTFSMATSGENLLNNNLQNFIFDSALATPTPDLQYILRRDGGPYNELCKHLINSKINESQKDAILKCIFAKDLAVIQGPPGSGKSTAIAELIWQLIRNGLKQGNKRERILLTSETNLAVDNAVSRIINSKTNLVKPIRFGGEEKLESEGLQFSIELMKKWVEIGNDALILDEEDEEDDAPESSVKIDLVLNNWLRNISDRSFYGMNSDENDVMVRWKRLLSEPDKEMRELVYRRYVENCNVIGATCSSIGDKKADGKGTTQFFRNYKEVFNPNGRSVKIEFTTVIQDESSKATPAELVLPFVYGKRAIVIGDHRQLPPMLDREEMENSLDYALTTARIPEDKERITRLQKFLETQFDKIEESHFQRLYEGADPSIKETFNLQYRMHPDINEVIKQFYLQDGGLDCGLVLPKDLGVNEPNFNNPASRYHGIDMRPFIGRNTHVLFINTESPEMLDGTSRVNYGEVEIIGKLLDRFSESSTFSRYLDKFEKEEDKQIGIISFYGKQIKQIRALANQHRNLPIRVSTVDRFQGMERNIIIVSMVRSHVIQTRKDDTPNFARYKKYGYPEQYSLGFAQSPNRLNVALSRAKRLLIIIGNEKHFSQHPIYAQLFKTIRSNPNNKVIEQSDL
jgi:adenylate kinase family enzyme